MAKLIDSIKLKESAQHLESVLMQYPDSDDVMALLRALRPLLELAKDGRISTPIESSRQIPGAYQLSDGAYVPYSNPSVGNAYAAFVVEMKGGLSKEEQELRTRIGELRKSQGNGHQ